MDEQAITPMPVTETAPAARQSLNAAQQLELERLHVDRVKFEAESAASQLELHKLVQAQNSQLRNYALNRAFRESAVKFRTTQDETLSLLGGEIEYGDDNHAPTVNGVPVAEALQTLALNTPAIADGRSLRALKPAEPKESAVQSKADLTSTAAKISFVNEFGLRAYENLPLRQPRIVEVKTFEDFQSLPVANRMKLIAEHGPNWSARLPRAVTEHSINRRAGMFVNRTKK